MTIQVNFTNLFAHIELLQALKISVEDVDPGRRAFGAGDSNNVLCRLQSVKGSIEVVNLNLERRHQKFLRRRVVCEEILVKFLHSYSVELKEIVSGRRREVGCIQLLLH